MITVKCSLDNFIYDVHSLVKAFYPGEDVKVSPVQSDETESCDIFIDYLSDHSEIKIFKDKELVSSKISEVSEISDRPEYKNNLKKALYESLSEYTGRKLPWGTLTGIRPTKIAVTQLEKGISDDEVRKYYKDVYLTSDQKADLSIEIAHREIDILSSIHYDEGYSLYIGIPFCPTTCLYCSFTSFPRSMFEKKINDYISCLKKEIDHVAENFKDKVLDSVYIGGGTPTTLNADELRHLISYLKDRIDMSKTKEFTVEAGRADSITEEKLIALKEMGVTRISVNPQTFKQETLDLIGRRHTVEQVLKAYELARRLGFDNINMDLIVGLPGETYDDVYETMQKVKELDPDSVTVHSLAIKRASRLNMWIEEHGIECITNSDDIMDMTYKICSEMGLGAYYLYRQKNMSGNFENVGYAKPGKEGIYNILIMEEKQSIVALGAGTVTKRVFHEDDNYRMERCDNVKDVNLYIEKIDEMIDRKRRLWFT
ncbi:MAG: coproporphyrinogen dehydrogenase HemZ [Lachnospiraceae bacterium]|nr:coproporphyrinogen dehydrogenase HemZ [Lachnospiraceae bacterium]